MKRRSIIDSLVLAIGISGINPIYASSIQNQELSTEGNATVVAVSATVPDTFKVTVPSSIDISLDSAGTINQNYDVTVQGDIASNKSIMVIPSSSFKLSTTGKPDITVTVNQDKTEFAYDEINGANGLTVQGTLSTSDKITAGQWVGSFTFDINVKTMVDITIWKEFTGEGGDNGVTTQTLTFNSAKEVSKVEGTYGGCDHSVQNNPCKGHYEITKPSTAFISLMCPNWEQTPVGAAPISYALDYEICLNGWINNKTPSSSDNTDGDIENATLTITQQDIDDAGEVYYLHIGARSKMLPNIPIGELGQTVYLVYGVYELD